MDSTQPSPLTLGPPQQALKPRVVLSSPENNAMQASTETGSSPQSRKMDEERQQIPQITLSSSPRTHHIHDQPNLNIQRLNTEPSITAKVVALSKYLVPRHQDRAFFRVIAVDGVDRVAVHLMISSLHYQITRDLQCEVRVIGGNFQLAASAGSNGLPRYFSEIHEWRAMWNLLGRSPPIAFNAGIPSGRSGQHLFRPATSRHFPCVYIFPISPLLSTLKASQIAGLCHYPPLHLWEWLAGHWFGHFSPDITVNIQEGPDAKANRGVLRIGGNNMRTLLVMKSNDKHYQLTPAQLRRVTFEVEEWLDTEN